MKRSEKDEPSVTVKQASARHRPAPSEEATRVSELDSIVLAILITGRERKRTKRKGKMKSNKDTRHNRPCATRCATWLVVSCNPVDSSLACFVSL